MCPCPAAIEAAAPHVIGIDAKGFAAGILSLCPRPKVPASFTCRAGLALPGVNTGKGHPGFAALSLLQRIRQLHHPGLFVNALLRQL